MSDTAPMSFYGLRPPSGGHRRPYGVPGKPDDTPQDISATWSSAAVLAIMVQPSAYFAYLRHSCRFSCAASFAMTHAALLTVVGFGAAVLGARSQAPIPLEAPDIVRLLAAAACYGAVSAAASLALTIVAAGLLHPFALVCGGRGGFASTYAAVVYAAVPASVLAVCGFCIAELLPEAATMEAWLTVGGALWSCVLYAIALCELHPLTSLAATLAGCVPLVVLAAATLWCYAPSPGRLPVVGNARSICSLRRALRTTLPGIIQASGTVKRGPTTRTSGSRKDHSPKSRTGTAR